MKRILICTIFLTLSGINYYYSNIEYVGSDIKIKDGKKRENRIVRDIIGGETAKELSGKIKGKKVNKEFGSRWDRTSDEEIDELKKIVYFINRLFNRSFQYVKGLYSKIEQLSLLMIKKLQKKLTHLPHHRSW